jgi:WD40 repeat protein
VPGAGRTLFETEDAGLGGWDIEVSPDGGSVAVNFLPSGEVWLGGVDGREFRPLPDGHGFSVAFSPDGLFVATAPGFTGADEGVWVWDASSGETVAELRLPGSEIQGFLSFTDDGRLLANTSKGVVAWDVESGAHEILVDLDATIMAASRDGRRLLLLENEEGDQTQDVLAPPVIYDLDTGTTTTLSSHGMNIHNLALDRAGTVVVSSDRSGAVRVGPVNGEEPHLLLGHEAGAEFLAIDPLGRFIASSGMDKTARLWPMPDLSQPPLHTLPRQELIAKLKTLTNLRVVRDAESSTGWTLTHDPFPGWETVPSW